jgi:pilus assembly protein CpaE
MGATTRNGPALVVVPVRPINVSIQADLPNLSEMADQIRVLVVDDIPETRDHLTKLLSFESDIDVVGAAASGREALEMATKLNPDVVLMDINMPDMDGIAATEQLSATVPSAAVVMMSVQGEADYLRRSMLAGAREFLVKPFSSDELTASIRQVHARERDKASRIAATTPLVRPTASSGGSGEGSDELGQVVAVFSPKGGVGRTTVAVNLAVAAATELGKKVVIVDGSFQFGDVGVLLNLNPRSKSIADLVPELEAGDLDSLDTFVITHSSGVKALLAPPSPEMAELVTPAGIKRIIEALRIDHDLVVVDCTAFFNDTTLAILDVADIILTMLSLEITSIKNMRLFLEVAEQLGYEAGKVRLILNRADSALGIRVTDVEHSIGRKVDETIVSDGRSVVYALNRGVPFFLSNKEAQVSQDILRLARTVTSSDRASAPAGDDSRKSTQKKSLFAWR